MFKVIIENDKTQVLTVLINEEQVYAVMNIKYKSIQVPNISSLKIASGN